MVERETEPALGRVAAALPGFRKAVRAGIALAVAVASAMALPFWSCAGTGVPERAAPPAHRVEPARRTAQHSPEPPMETAMPHRPLIAVLLAAFLAGAAAAEVEREALGRPAAARLLAKPANGPRSLPASSISPRSKRARCFSSPTTA